MGYEKDTAAGKIIEWNHGIDQEWMQQSKILTHSFQEEMRIERERKLVEKFKAKVDKERKVLLEFINQNKSMEESLLDALRDKVNANQARNENIVNKQTFH